MGIPQMITRGRIAAEKLMQDVCLIQRVTAQSVGAGGVITPTYTQIYAGKCRVVRRSPGSFEDVGEQVKIMTGLVVWIPVMTVLPREGDRITITSARYDPLLVGKVFVVRDAPRSSSATRLEINVTELTS